MEKVLYRSRTLSLVRFPRPPLSVPLPSDLQFSGVRTTLQPFSAGNGRYVRAIKADDADSLASAIEELHARWMRDELADSGISSSYTAETATRQIIALANKSLTRKSLHGHTDHFPH